MHFTAFTIGSIATLAASTVAAPAGGPQQPVAPNQYLLRVDVEASGLDINQLGYTSLVSYANGRSKHLVSRFVFCACLFD